MKSILFLELKLLICACVVALLASNCERTRTEEEQKPTGIAALLCSEADLPGGWKVADTVRVFTGRQLYEYINGGADLFLEYGFVKVAAGEYLTPGGKTVFINLYRMSDPDAAFGIFSATRRPEYEVVAIGTMGARTDYQQIFCRGSYYIETQAMDTDSLTQREMEYLCGAVNGKIADEPTAEPEALEYLPESGYLPHSGVLVRGPLALNSRKYLSDENIFALSDTVPGALASYRLSEEREQPSTFLVVNYPDSATAVRVFDSLEQFYRDRAKGKENREKLQLQEDRLIFPTNRGFDIIRLRGKMITAIFDLAEIPEK